jgi:hypothetical protein
MGIYRRTHGPESWQELLADPQKQWVTGYSARTLAHCWEDAEGLPPEIAAYLTDIRPCCSQSRSTELNYRAAAVPAKPISSP